MSPQIFTGSSSTYDLENYIEKLKRVFGVMNVAKVERVELVLY